MRIRDQVEREGNFIDGAIFYAPNEFTFTIANYGYHARTIKREILDSPVLDATCSAGVQFHAKTKIIKIEKEKIIFC